MKQADAASASTDLRLTGRPPSRLLMER